MNLLSIAYTNVMTISVIAYSVLGDESVKLYKYNFEKN